MAGLLAVSYPGIGGGHGSTEAIIEARMRRFETQITDAFVATVTVALLLGFTLLLYFGGAA